MSLIPGAAVAFQTGPEKAHAREFFGQVERERRFAKVLIDDRKYFFINEFADGLPDQLFLIVQQGVKLDEV